MVNLEERRKNYLSIKNSLEEIGSQIEQQLSEYFGADLHIDKTCTRAKSESSFLTKIEKKNMDGSLKYPYPFRQIQDMIGCRIVVYYKSDITIVAAKAKKIFNQVEDKDHIPDSPSEFGYEGHHSICLIPPNIYNKYKTDQLIPYFFELQIKTLYQHAWAQSQHGIGYKPDEPLTFEEKRNLAFIAAQSWGADEILLKILEDRAH